MADSQRIPATPASPPLRAKLGPNRRVHLERDANRIFQEGKREFFYPYRFLYYIAPATALAPAGLRLMVKAPKRTYKLAVARNAQKRRVRELFRTLSPQLHRHCLAHQLHIDLAVIPVSKDEVKLEKASKAMARVLASIGAQCHPAP